MFKGFHTNSPSVSSVLSDDSTKTNKTNNSNMTNKTNNSNKTIKTIKSTNTLNTIRHIKEKIHFIPPTIKDDNEVPYIKDVSRHTKPFQEISHCAYDEYLKYDQQEFIKENDYIWRNDNIYFILEVKNNIFSLINLETNKIEKEEYPFYYCKIDGNDPNVLYNMYINIKSGNTNKKYI